jgi:hypothetical protein
LAYIQPVYDSPFSLGGYQSFALRKQLTCRPKGL